jgi:WD40 repeat protein
VFPPKENTVRIWDAATGIELEVLRGHQDSVWSAAFSPDGSRIVTASADRTARIWDASTGSEITVLRGNEHPLVRSAAFSPDGTRVSSRRQMTRPRESGTPPPGLRSRSCAGTRS